MTELERYWNFAAKAYRRAGSDPELLAYMRLHIQFGHKMVPAVDAELLDALTAELGEPAERSQTVAVWEL